MILARAAAAARRTRVSLVLCAVLLGGCAVGGGARLTGEWRDPDYPRDAIRSMVIVSTDTDPSARQGWEDEIREEMRHERVRTLTSYDLFGDERPTRDDVADALADGRADAALVLRRVDPYGNGRWQGTQDELGEAPGPEPTTNLDRDRDRERDDRTVVERVTVWVPGENGVAGRPYDEYGDRDRRDRDAERARERERGEWDRDRDRRDRDRDRDSDRFRDQRAPLRRVWTGTIEVRDGRGSEDRVREQVAHVVVPGLKRARLLP